MKMSERWERVTVRTWTTFWRSLTLWCWRSTWPLRPPGWSATDSCPSWNPRRHWSTSAEVRAMLGDQRQTHVKDVSLCLTLLLFVSHSGLVVDQDALVKALQCGTIGAAALDVTHPEPLPRSRPAQRTHTLTLNIQNWWFGNELLFFFLWCRDHPLLTLPNVVITPHLGTNTYSTTRQMVQRMVESAVAAVTGQPIPDEVKPKWKDFLLN